MYGFLFVLGIILLIVVMNLRGRVRRLENIVRAGALQPAVPPPQAVVSAQGELVVPKAIPTAAPAVGAPAPAVTLPPLPEKESDALERFLEWLKDDWLLKLGAGLILIGFGWLVTYAFLHNWIGPVGRIALGLVAGTAILILGWWRIRTYLNQGGVFLVLGSSTILVTIFAAREVYGFFTPLSALAVMFLSVVFVALASVRFRSHALSLLSLAMAGIAPMLTSMPRHDYPMYFTYLFVVVLGTLWIVALTRRQELTTAALILVAFYSVPHFIGLARSPDRDALLLISYAFAAVFFIATTLGILKAQGKELAADLVTAGGSGMLLLAWILSAAQDEWKSLLIAAWMVVYAVGAFAVFRFTRRREPMYVYAGVAVAMLAAATAAELDGAALNIAYTVECAVVALVAYVTTRDVGLAERLSYLLIGPFILSFNSIFSRLWRFEVLHKDFFVLLALALVLFFLGGYFFLKRKAAGEEKISDYNLFLLIAGSAYIYLIIWRSLHAAIRDEDLAAMIALVTYTLIGLCFYFAGRVRDAKVPRVYGAAMLGGVVLRLLIVDVWSMELTGRIITFFMVGALLVSTAFLGRKKTVALVLFLGLSALGAAGVSAQSFKSPSRADIISAYRQYREVSSVSVSVPTVVQISFADQYFERPQFAVFNQTSESFEPNFVQQDVAAVKTPLSIAAGTRNGYAMTDGNPGTYAEFPLPESTQGRAQLTLTTPYATTFSGLALLLDNHVALPTSVSIRAMVDGMDRIVVAERRMDQATVRFPRTTSAYWTVNLAYAQPLRITEMRMIEESAGQVSTLSLRFLARPGHRYRVYFDPDRTAVAPTGEAGNFALNQDVLALPSLPAQPNPQYRIADVDGDGIADVRDNCVDTPNADQKDMNRNGRGDACDDFDRDGILNSRDNCPEHTNRAQADTDGDSIGDACDEQESRLTERLPWLPWVGIGAAALVVIILLIMTARMPAGGDQSPK